MSRDEVRDTFFDGVDETDDCSSCNEDGDGDPDFPPPPPPLPLPAPDDEAGDEDFASLCFFSDEVTRLVIAFSRFIL